MSDPLFSSPLGVCVLPRPNPNQARAANYPHYIHEMLGHAGLCHEAVPFEDLGERLPGLRLLVTVGEWAFPADLKGRLREWVARGGGWLSIGGLCGMGDLQGAEYAVPGSQSWGGGMNTLGEGYMRAESSDHPTLIHAPLALHFFNGLPVEAREAAVLATVLDAHHRPTGRPAFLERQVEAGRCLLIAPDVTGAIVRIQQGVAITGDGVPASDGTAPLSDGILKSDDGAVLDWLLDREPVPGVPGLFAFLQPIADQWREVVLRALFHLATTQRIFLPLLWLYPRNLPALAHLSHDTDGNVPEKARRLLDTLATAAVRSTWCTILPGYDARILAAIRAAGHELAMHYDALECPWSEAQFDAQWRTLTERFDGEKPVTNKNHYLRWEGDTEFFDWCEKRGIGLDQSKGASKTGEAGFNFGTCHPYFPVAPDGRVIDVLELPTPTQDLRVFGPEEILEPLLAAAARHQGVLHLLFHPGHIDKEGVADALLRAVRQARERGLEWWTARQINDWERARRQVRWSGYRRERGEVSVSLRAGTALPEATVLWMCPGSTPVPEEGQAGAMTKVIRWGFPFHALTVDLREGREQTLRLIYRE